MVHCQGGAEKHFWVYNVKKDGVLQKSTAQRCMQLLVAVIMACNVLTFFGQRMSAWEGIQLEKCPYFHSMLFKGGAKLWIKEAALEKEG